MPIAGTPMAGRYQLDAHTAALNILPALFPDFSKSQSLAAASPADAEVHLRSLQALGLYVCQLHFHRRLSHDQRPGNGGGGSGPMMIRDLGFEIEGDPSSASFTDPFLTVLARKPSLTVEMK